MPISDVLPNNRVLFVEDDRETCDLLAHVLAGFDLTFVDNVKLALTMVQNSHYDVYVLDNWLPDGSGIELCRTIRAQMPDAPILITSAAAMERNIEEAKRAGASRYIVKPYDPFDLLEIIKEHLDRPEVQGSSV